MLLLGVPAARDLKRGGASRPLVGDLTAAELVASEEAYLGARVRALMVGLGAHDGSTEDHTRRVALLAVQVGEELSLPPATLRHLAVGGLLHDIGKLSVAGDILRKPGALSDEEFAEIKRHPEAGVRLLRELGGLRRPRSTASSASTTSASTARLPVAASAAEQLAIGPRILAVCDVYDALVSDRVYREAWTSERALALLYEQAGSAFDPACVQSLAQVVAPAPVAVAATVAVARAGAPAIRVA